jgi:hypothetical protein
MKRYTKGHLRVMNDAQVASYLAEAEGLEPPRLYGPDCFQDSFLIRPDRFRAH